jgi:hypothetical protein
MAAQDGPTDPGPARAQYVAKLEEQLSDLEAKQQ